MNPTPATKNGKRMLTMATFDAHVAWNGYAHPFGFVTGASRKQE